MISPFTTLKVALAEILPIRPKTLYNQLIKLRDICLTGQSTAGSDHELAATPASEPLQSTSPSSVYSDETKTSWGLEADKSCPKKATT